mgnify:FL=1
MGQYFEFEKLANEEIIKKMKHKFSIINFNERVSYYLKTRFNLDSDEQLYSIFEPKLITITFGKKGVEFIYNNNVYKYSLTCSTPEVDSTGAGDAFFSSIIKDWIKTNLNFDINKFEKWYDNSIKLTSKVVKKMGDQN